MLQASGWPADALEVMFEEYWLSGAPMIGEVGGAGWAAWMAGESPLAAAAAAAAAPGSTQRQRRAAQQMQDLDDEAARAGGKQQGGKQTGAQAEGAAGAAAAAAAAAAGADGSSAKGWSGWEELAPAIRARFGHSLQLGGEDAAEAAAAGEGEEAAETGGAGEGEEAATDDLEPPAEEEEETEEQLLERLGLRLEEALEEAPSELSPPLLDRWLATERSREGVQWQPRRAEAAEAAAAAARAAEAEEFGPLSDAEEEEEEEAPHRSVAWRDVRRLLWRFESPAARQQLLAGCLRLLGAPVPGSLPSNSAAAAAAASGCDELWWAAAVAGCFPGRRSPSASGQASSGWAADLLGQGDWSWLLGGNTSGTPPGLRHRPWYVDGDAPTRRSVLTQLLTALLRGPCRQDARLAAALLVSHMDVGSCDHDASLLAPRPMVSSGADELAKQLLAEQRTNLALWQAYAQLQVASGSLKAARKVYQTCFATVGAPTGLAAAAAAAPLVLGAVQLELLGDIHTQGPAALPSAGAAAPAWSACSLLPWLSELCPPFGPLAAARQLAWLGSGGAVALPGPPSAGPPAALEPQDIVAAKRGFQDLLLALLRQQQEAQQQQQQRRQGGNGGGGSGSLSAGGRALVTAAAAFEQLAGHLRGDLGGGVKAALAIYEQVLAALLPPPAQLLQPGQHAGPADPELEVLAWQRCQLAADAAQRALPCAPPAAVREALLRTLWSFPASPALLQLLVAHEAAGHTLAQLRRELHGLVELAPSPQVWLAMLAAEVSTRSPGAAVQSVLERAVSHDSGRHCPLLWRLYLRFEAHRGRHDAVKRLFLRAIGACPWAKALWCDGLALLNGRAPPKELSEYIEVMKDKELVLRTDVFEVLLQQLEAQQGAAAAAGGDQPAAAGGADASG